MSIYNIENIAIEALKNSKKTVEKLGSSGEESVVNNQFGEMSLKADIEAEKAVLKTFQDAKVPIRIISEEHGITDITGNPVYLGVLDGIDGTNNYKEDRINGRYGTMLGIFSNINPKFDDYLFGGVIEHTTGKLFYALKNHGSKILMGNKIKNIKCSNNLHLDSETTIYIDGYWEINRKTFTSRLKGFNIQPLTASCVNYIDLIYGVSDFALECTRKNNLEIAAAYGLVKESGGVFVTLDGHSIGSKKYLVFGQKKDEHIPLIASSTYELAQKLIEHIK